MTIVDLGSNDQLYEHDSQLDSDNSKTASETDFVASMKEKMMEELGGRVGIPDFQSVCYFWWIFPYFVDAPLCSLIVFQISA